MFGEIIFLIFAWSVFVSVFALKFWYVTYLPLVLGAVISLYNRRVKFLIYGIAVSLLIGCAGGSYFFARAFLG